MHGFIFIIAASLPSYLIRFKIGAIPTTALEVLLLFTFGVWLIRKLCKKELFIYFKNFSSVWLVIIVLWLTVATAAIFVSPNIRGALGTWKAYFIEPILFLFVFVDVIKTRRDLSLIFAGLGITAIYIGVLAILQKFFGLPIPPPWQNELRVTSVFEYPNAVGLFLGPLVPIFIGELGIRNNELRRRAFFAVAALSSIAAIVLAKSEGAILGVAAGLFIMGLLWGRKTRQATLIVTLALAAIVLATPVIRHYVAQKTTLSDWSGYVRKKMWVETWEMLQDRPIIGTGLAGYQTAIAPYHKTKAIEIFLYPHNIILNFWSELGLFGLLVFLWIMILFYIEALKNIPKLEIRNLSAKVGSASGGKFEIAMLTSMTALLIHGLVDVPYFKNDLSVLFWLIIGLVLILKKREKNEQSLMN